MKWERRMKVDCYLFFICMFLLLIFTTMIAIIIYYKSINLNFPKEEICLTSVCKNEAGRILQNMDNSVNPCDDFYSFTCGSYYKYKDVYSDWINPLTELRGYVKFLQKETLEKQEEGLPNYVEKVKMYYQSCLRKSTSVQKILNDFLQATRIPSWPYTDNVFYKYSNTNVEDIIAKSFIYDDTGLFFSINSYHKNGSLYYIKIFPGNGAINNYGLLNDTDEYFIFLKQKYISLFRYVLMNIGLKSEKIIQIMDEVINLETSLAEIKENERSDNFTMITIKNLESSCSEIKWTSLFKFMFEFMEHPQNYSNDIQLKVEDMEIMLDLCRLVGRTHPRIIYNSIVWNIFINYLYQVDFVFRQLATDWKRDISIGSSYFKSRSIQKWKKCLANLKKPFLVGLDYYLLNYTQSEEKIKEIKNFIKQILKSTEEIFSEEKWLDDFSKIILKSKVRNIKFRIGYANSSFVIPKLIEIFSNINVTDNYVQNILEVDKYIYIDTFFEETLSQLWSHLGRFQVFKVNAYYSEQQSFKGRLTIPLGIMQPPYYVHGAPQYLNYAGIGNIIAHEISHGFDSLDRLQKKASVEENKQEIEWSEQFLQEFEKRTKCFINQYSQFILEGNITLNGNKTIKDDLSDNSAVVQSFRAYEKYLQQHGEEPKLPGLNFTNKQMFFIGFAQKNCEKLEFARTFYEKDYHSPSRYRTLIPLMNFPEFSKVFECPKNSNMNPEKKCIMWG
ncbi:endothelin-converting enzyme 1-like [Centruroides vittatus]|uniref:endothelin-converting enzyme 1-like n=1 Tax=Centruroides vittatus TaxID=120091 RepID=UPI00350EC981